MHRSSAATCSKTSGGRCVLLPYIYERRDTSLGSSMKISRADLCESALPPMSVSGRFSSPLVVTGGTSLATRVFFCSDNVGLTRTILLLLLQENGGTNKGQASDTAHACLLNAPAGTVGIQQTDIPLMVTTGKMTAGSYPGRRTLLYYFQAKLAWWQRLRRYGLIRIGTGTAR
jgi:hypothetical protein